MARLLLVDTTRSPSLPCNHTPNRLPVCVCTWPVIAHRLPLLRGWEQHHRLPGALCPRTLRSLCLHVPMACPQYSHPHMCLIFVSGTPAPPLPVASHVTATALTTASPAWTGTPPSRRPTAASRSAADTRQHLEQRRAGRAAGPATTSTHLNHLLPPHWHPARRRCHPDARPPDGTRPAAPRPRSRADGGMDMLAATTRPGSAVQQHRAAARARRVAVRRDATLTSMIHLEHGLVPDPVHGPPAPRQQAQAQPRARSSAGVLPRFPLFTTLMMSTRSTTSTSPNRQAWVQQPTAAHARAQRVTSGGPNGNGCTEITFADFDELREHQRPVPHERRHLDLSHADLRPRGQGGLDRDQRTEPRLRQADRRLPEQAIRCRTPRQPRATNAAHRSRCRPPTRPGGPSRRPDAR